MARLEIEFFEKGIKKIDEQTRKFEKWKAKLREIFTPIFKYRSELHDRDKIEENVDSQNKEEIMLKAYVQINEAGSGIDILEEGQNIPNTLVMSIEEAIKFAKENNKVFYPSGVDEVDRFINYMMNN